MSDTRTDADRVAEIREQLAALERVRAEILSECTVKEALRISDRIQRFRGDRRWLDMRDSIPDGAFVSLDALIRLRQTLAADDLREVAGTLAESEDACRT